MVDFEQKSSYTVEDLVHIVAILRAPGGCPWDAEQTHESIRMNFLEETYEVADAIDRKDAHLLCEELGDVLLQIVLHSQMEAEKSVFTLDDVADGICKKLIYRHPHVFGDVTVADTEEVLQNWDALKNKEKQRNTVGEDMDSVPEAMPALMRASKVQKRSLKANKPLWNAQAAAADVNRRAQALQTPSADAANEYGALLFSTVFLGRCLGVDPEEELTNATARYIAAVKAADAEGNDISTMPAVQLQALLEGKTSLASE